ncbi:hypothetical protein EUGRSUZ_I02099 [Eucalyptus grandis]|uniref:Uncharacterized protein n=2 Tax=Eucalyptus grandis TaxID=71139 RepID=A0ACC3JHE4_EUCGR|nr:hypothetical protein EUGRSUZ_I02099 [Eucalyptus grandis]
MTAHRKPALDLFFSIEVCSFIKQLTNGLSNSYCGAKNNELTKNQCSYFMNANQDVEYPSNCFFTLGLC